jgi:hypothetical protein
VGSNPTLTVLFKRFGAPVQHPLAILEKKLDPQRRALSRTEVNFLCQVFAKYWGECKRDKAQKILACLH